MKSVPVEWQYVESERLGAYAAWVHDVGITIVDRWSPDATGTRWVLGTVGPNHHWRRGFDGTFAVAAEYINHELTRCYGLVRKRGQLRWISRDKLEE